MAAQALWVGIALPACHGMADFLDHLRCCWLTLECLVRGGEPTLDALLGGAEHGYIFLGMTQWHKCGFPTPNSHSRSTLAMPVRQSWLLLTNCVTG